MTGAVRPCVVCFASHVEVGARPQLPYNSLRIPTQDVVLDSRFEADLDSFILRMYTWTTSCHHAGELFGALLPKPMNWLTLVTTIYHAYS